MSSTFASLLLTPPMKPSTLTLDFYRQREITTGCGYYPKQRQADVQASKVTMQPFLPNTSLC